MSDGRKTGGTPLDFPGAAGIGIARLVAKLPINSTVALATSNGVTFFGRRPLLP